MAKLFSRRGLLQSGLTTAVTGAALLGSARRTAASDKVCADSAKLDDGQKSLRAALNYVEQSSDPSKSCTACGFFQPAGDGCGTCQIFSGPANANGHCESWAAKG
jgi:hypothetical protein